MGQNMTQMTYFRTNTLVKNKTNGTDRNLKLTHEKILVVDDEPDTIFLLRSILEQEGYEVAEAADGLDALQKMKQTKPSLVITDMMMPQMDGWTTIKKLHEISDVPIIVLSVLNQTESIIRALELGADDYITKPFDQTEVVARLESVLRRGNHSSKISRIGIEGIGLILDLDTHEAFYQNHVFQLTGKMFDVLSVLMENAPKLVTYEQLTTIIWGEDSPAIRNRLKYLIYLLRQEFQKNGANADFINNIGRLGYKISAH